MPANLPPQYHEAEKRLKTASSPAEKTAILEEMLRIMPKHKGTDHLQADLKSRIAKLKREQTKAGGPKKASGPHVVKEGAGQVALVGAPNAGKSSLLAALTKAKPLIADYPHTTREPLPGMMAFEDIQIQLLDLPPLAEEYNEPWVWELIKRADLIWLVLGGLSPLGDLERVEAILAGRGIGLLPAGAKGPAEPDQDRLSLPALVPVTKADKAETLENLEVMEELMEGRWPLIPVSSQSGSGLDRLGRLTFQGLAILRAYTKQPGKPPDRDNPFTLPQGATVGMLAAKIHKDVAARMKQARLWGRGEENSRTVHRDHPLNDGDTVEIQI
jgi:ribosome-interacting GTPase 1